MEQAATTQHNNQRLMVIDDEKPVGAMLKIMLENSGYEVTVESNGAAALKIFRGKARNFDLVITDLVMPGLSGFDIAREFRLIRPSVPIIMCSGGDPFFSREYATAGIQAYVMKPFSCKELTQTIRHILDGKKRLGLLTTAGNCGGSSRQEV